MSNIHNNTLPFRIDCELFPGPLARGMSRPGKAPTSGRKALSPGVCLARGKHPHPVRPRSSVPAAHRVSVTSPRTGLGETPYTTTVSSLWTNGVLSPQYPSSAGVPSNARGFTSTFRTLPNIQPIQCGLRKQAPQSTKSPIRLNSFPCIKNHSLHIIYMYNTIYNSG